MPVITPGGGGGGGAPNGLVVKDLGVISVVGLVTGGPHTIYTPKVGEYVQIVIGNPGYVQFLPNTSIFDLQIAQSTGITADATPAGLSGGVVPPSGVTVTLPSGIQVTGASRGYVSSSTDPFVAFAVSSNSGFNMTAALTAWAATTAYASEVMILGPDNHVWSSSGGTSGGTIPNFAANEGGTVADNNITWKDEGVVPTSGSVHLYAVTGTPA